MSILEDRGVLITQYQKDLSFDETPAKVIYEAHMRYTVHKFWLGAVILCSSLLVLAGFVGVVMKWMTRAPDFLGYASSLTMMNPFIPTPTPGSTLDGLERANILRDWKVKIADVRPDDPEGLVALTLADDETAKRLKLDRKYI